MTYSKRLIDICNTYCYHRYSNINFNHGSQSLVKLSILSNQINAVVIFQIAVKFDWLP